MCSILKLKVCLPLRLNVCFDLQFFKTDGQLIMSLSFPMLGVAHNKVEFSNFAHTALWGTLSP